MTSLHRFTGWAFFLGFAILAVSLNACSSSGGNSGPGRVLTSIAVTPLTASINVNATQQFKATGTYSDGSTQDITSTAQWKSSDTTVATIQSNGGLASGAGAGTAQITASLSGIVSPPASLTVTASGSTPALVQHVSSSNTRNNGFSSPFCYHFQLPNPTTASNAVVVGFTFNGNPTPRVTDDKGNPYAIEANHFDSADNQSIGIAAAFNIAAGARVINLCFSADPGGFVQPMATEFSNVTGVDGTGVGSNGSGTSASTGNVTPTQTGDLVYQVVSSFSTTPSKLPSQSRFTAGSQANINWSLLSADLMDGFAGQFGVYNSAAAINPTITMGTNQNWVSAAVLLKTGTAGSVPTGMRIVHLTHENIPTHTGSGGTGSAFPQVLPLQLACSGNLLVAMIGGGNPTNTVSSISDTKANAWTLVPAPGTQVINGNDTVQAFYAPNATSSPDLALTLNWSTNGGGDFTIFFYDVTGAAAAPLDSVKGTTGNQSALGNLTLPFMVTPSTANEIIFVQTIWDFNTGIGLTGSGSGQLFFFDTNTFDGENLDGPEPVDENNGWGHVLTTNTNAVTFTWIPKDPTQHAFGNWAANAVAFKAGP